MVALSADWPNCHSNYLYVDLVVLGVGTHEPNVNDPEFVVSANDKSIFVSTNVEDDSVSLGETGMPIPPFDVIRAFPSSLRSFPVPRFQGLFRWSMLLPECFQCASRDDSHLANISMVPIWEQCPNRGIGSTFAETFSPTIADFLASHDYRNSFTCDLSKVF